MLQVDRANYCPNNAYEDTPIQIGYNATISAPHMHAKALEILRDHLHSEARVLDVGSGSGYLTACMALMTKPNGKVFGIEHIPELVSRSKANVEKDQPGLLETGRLKFVTGDGRVGLGQEGPFDVIHVGATAPGLPVELIEQLKKGGRMVVPIQKDIDNQIFEQIDKLPNGEIRRQELLRVRYVPLTDRKYQLD